MNYISGKKRKELSNEPYEISMDDLQFMLKQNDKDKRECERVTKSSSRGESYFATGSRLENEKLADQRLALYKEVLYRDTKTEGMLMHYPHGSVILQGERNSYYRGENQIYNKSIPSMFRKMEVMDEESRKAYRFISKMRIEEFKSLLHRFDIVKDWEEQYGPLLYEPLAQHYGLETEWLDITSDLEVALFFATCRWDVQDKRWYPLTKLETKDDEKKKYGVIFHIPGNRAKMLSVPPDDEYGILPIGYQPFMRCSSQHAYGIYMKESKPLQENIMFEKLYFRQNERLSQEIYEKMNGGKEIYPNEGLDDFEDIIDKIKKATNFSQEAYFKTLESSEIYSSDIEARRMLTEHKIEIVSDVSYKASKQRIKRFNRRNEKFSLDGTYGIKPMTRIVAFSEKKE